MKTRRTPSGTQAAEAPPPIPAPTPVVTGDRLELMQTFVRIVEAGGFSAAASQLGVSQPAVSRRLQALEESLGLQLLQRGARANRLTPDGQRYFEQAKELLHTWTRFEAELRGAKDEPEGLLRVVAPHVFGQERLIRPLVAYLRRFPKMAVEWRLHDEVTMQEYIADGIDCAIRVGEVTAPGLVAVRLAEVPRIAVAAPALVAGMAAPCTPDDLARLPWLALGTYYRSEIALTRNGTQDTRRIAIAPRLITDSLHSLRSAALAGLGVGVCSRWMVADDLASGRLVQLAPEWQAAPLPVSLVYPYARFYPARLRQFAEIVKQMAPDIFDRTGS